MRLNFTIRDCTDSNRPKVHDYVAMLRRILTQYPHAEFVFQFAPDGILSFYGEFLPDIKGIAWVTLVLLSSTLKQVSL